MELAGLRPLPCPQCGQRNDLAVWLDQPGRRLVTGRVVEVRCAGCGATCQIQLESGRAAMGILEAGDAFRPEFRVEQPELEVEASPAGLLVRVAHRSWAAAR